MCSMSSFGVLCYGDASRVEETAPKHKHFGANSNSTTLYDRNLKSYSYRATQILFISTIPEQNSRVLSAISGRIKID
jgi:hypothetical protein